jgi:transcriptional regulator with XRE-family HTH domain
MKMYQRQKVPGQREHLRKGVNESVLVHPIVQWIWKQINDQRASQEDVAMRAGVASSTLRKWRDGVRSPRVVELESVVNVLGYNLKVVLQEGKNSE